MSVRFQYGGLQSACVPLLCRVGVLFTWEWLAVGGFDPAILRLLPGHVACVTVSVTVRLSLTPPLALVLTTLTVVFGNACDVTT